MFDKFGSALKLLYINLPNEHFKSSVEIENRIAVFLQKADDNLNKINDVAYQADYSVEHGIINYSNKIGADLIAIPTHGRKGVSHFFAGSIGEDVLSNPQWKHVLCSINICSFIPATKIIDNIYKKYDNCHALSIFIYC